MIINIDDFSPVERQIFFITQQFMSVDIDAYSSAMVSSRDDFKSMEKSGYNSHSKYYYAKIEDIYNAIIPALTKHGIQIDHFRFAITDGRELLITRLTHCKSKQFRQDSSWLDAEKPGHQAKGSALTYMKKYAVLNLCGLAPDEDDDAATADGKKQDDKSKQNSNWMNEEISDKQIDLINDLIAKYPVLEKQFSKEIDNCGSYTKGQASEFITQMENFAGIKRKPK